MPKSRIEQHALAAIFSALGNPHRLALFERLCSCCVPGTSCPIDQSTQLSVGELGVDMDIAPSTLSHHLKTLRHAGLVHTERRGKQVVCWVDPQVLSELSSFFSSHLQPASAGNCQPGVQNV